MPADKTAGRASSFTLLGTVLPIKKYTPKTTRKLIDTTDSANYDAATDMLYASQVPTMISQELTVEGIFDLNSTPTVVMNLLFSGAAAAAVVLGLKSGVLYGSGVYDISDFSTDVPVDDVVSWSATFKLNGKFTPGA